MYLLDTNVISELRRSRPHGAVLAWLGTVDSRTLYLSAASIGELQAGIEITRRRDAAKAAEIEEWIDHIVGHWNILPMDMTAFRLWAKLIHGKSDALIEDGMIAATALTHSLTVVTRNIRHFREFEVPLLDPFSYR
jgi:predicted nucleic acid-binding protein